MAVSAATISRPAPASESGQPSAKAVTPSTAIASARDNGLTSTTPWRRASRETRSSGGASIGGAGFDKRGKNPRIMGMTAKRAAVVTLVAGSIVVLAMALWKIKVVIAL